MNGCVPVAGFNPKSCTESVNRWIVGKFFEASGDVTKAIEDYKFNEAAQASYHFTWGTFCDWYLEFTKPILQGDNEAAKAETQATTAWVLDQLLHLLHPMMPYITEELWRQLADDRDGMLITGKWPEVEPDLIDAEAATEMDWVVRLVSQVRTVRSEMRVPPGAKIPLILKGAGEVAKARLAKHIDLITGLARLSGAQADDGDAPKGAVQDVIDEATIILPIAEAIDIDQEKARLTKEIGKLDSEISKYDKKLSNQGFLSKAPSAVVEEQTERRDDMVVSRQKLDGALQRLAAL